MARPRGPDPVDDAPVARRPVVADGKVPALRSASAPDYTPESQRDAKGLDPFAFFLPKPTWIMVADDPLSNDRNIDSEWREALARHGQTRVYPPRAIMIHEGDAGDLLFLIHEGSGRIYSTNEAGRVIVYDVFGPGDLLGEPTLDGGVRSASVMTLKKTTVTVIRAADFKALIAGNPALALHVIFRLIRLLRASNEHIKSLALDDVYGRVVRLLMKTATPVEDHWVIQEKFTQQNIADHVGSSREMVSRIMKDLEKGHYLSVAKDSITIHRKPPPGW